MTPRVLTYQRCIFRWFRFRRKTADYPTTPAPVLFRWFYAHLPIWRFTAVTMTPTLDRLLLMPEL